MCDEGLRRGVTKLIRGCDELDIADLGELWDTLRKPETPSGVMGLTIRWRKLLWDSG